MFLYNVLVAGFIFLCFCMVVIILFQKGKSSMGFGNLGGSTQLLFGGSGGQDLFQKITWVMATLFMGGSLILAMMKRPSESKLLGEIARQQTVPVIPATPPLPQQASQ